MMLVVCEGTQAPQEELRAKFFECLVKIANLYYDYLADYMQRIFDVSVFVIFIFLNGLCLCVACFSLFFFDDVHFSADAFPTCVYLRCNTRLSIALSNCLSLFLSLS